MKNIKWGRVAPVAVLAGALVGSIALSADASEPTPALRQAASSSIPNSAGAVTNWHLGKGVVYGDNLGPGMAKWFTTVWDNTVSEKALDPNLRAKVNATTGKVKRLEADGPYPGSTDLSKIGDPGTQGSNSLELVPADAKSHTVWVKCADGKVALGGGFRLGADQGDAVASKIQVTASEPTGDAITGDPAGSILPTGWQVEVINSGTVAATVRPFVTCIKIG